MPRAPATTAQWRLTLLGLALLGAALPLLLTGELQLLSGARLLGAGTSDVWGHAWGYWWVQEALTQLSLPGVAAPVNHPTGQDWWVVDLPVAIVLSPIEGLFGAAVATNASAALRLSLALPAMAHWLLRIGLSGRLAVAAALALVTGPTTRGTLHSGIPEALSILLVPLFGLWLLAWLREGSGGLRTLLLALWLVADGLYAGLAGGLVGAGVVLAEVRSRQGLLRACLAGLPAGALGAGLWMAQRVLDHPALSAPESTPGGNRLGATVPVGGSDLSSLVAHHDWLGALAERDHHPQIAYLGIPLLLLAAWAATRRGLPRRLVLMGGLATLLALGSRLQVAGTVWLDLPLPGALLTHLGAENIQRFAALAAALLLGGGLVSIGPRARWVALGLITLDTALAFPMAVPTVPNPAGPVEQWLSTESGAVLDLPLDRCRNTIKPVEAQRTFFLQTVHGRPIASALMSTSTACDSEVRGVKALHAALGASSRTNREVPLPSMPPLVARRSTKKLQDMAFTAVVLDADRVNPHQRDSVLTFLTDWLGTPANQHGDRLAWTLGPVSPGASTAPR